MNKKQFAEHIGNMDDRLVAQAEHIPNYTVLRRHRRARQLLATASVLALMFFSFSVGAMAFAREITVEVPVKRETLELEGIGLTLILPDSWEGQYSVEKNGENFVVYIPQIKEKNAGARGILFTIVCYGESMTEEQFIENGLDVTAYRYILATSSKTYILHYASDVQYDPTDKEQDSTYQRMISEIKDIQFSVNHVIHGNNYSLRHYSSRIRSAALENGHASTDTEGYIKRRLLTALFQFCFGERALPLCRESS